jgi:3',5'-cyclic AMP phosphodiesterase CpdA
MATIAHLSDLHFGRVDPRLLEPLIRTIVAAAPDLVAVSGDLTQRARDRQFRAARAFLDRLPFPRLVVPGNHDVPLHNLAARFFNPYGGYRRHIDGDLEPQFESADIVVVGLNSARNFPFDGGGRLNARQVQQASARLTSAPDGAVKIIVTHHPFDLPDTHARKHLIGRSDMAMRQLAAAGADVFLAGHLHVSHVGHAATRYPIAGHSALVVQAGTMSTRTRGESNALNLLRVEPTQIAVERLSWDEGAQNFALTWRGAFHREPNGWFPR